LTEEEEDEVRRIS